MTVFHHSFSSVRAARAGWLVFSMGTCLLMSPARAQDSGPISAAEMQRTEAGVIATDNHWSLAEYTGDTAYLDQMLLPPYQSVNVDGTAHSKAQILAGAAKSRGTDLATANSKVAAYRSAHPYGTNVTIHDDTAVVTFYDQALGAQRGIKSSDIFVYVDGHWHAIYSQHTQVGQAH
jgi:hypothetical protein